LNNNSGSLAKFAAIRRASPASAATPPPATIAIQGQGAPIACAQAQFNVATTGTNEE
jgi:hypothetical protein